MKSFLTLAMATFLGLATGQAMAVPVTVESYSEYPNSAGTAVGTGTGDLVDGVLTYEMEYVIDIVIFDPATLVFYGELFDGTPPTGETTILSCEGSPFICDGVELDSPRDESFESGGPLSETEVTILTTGTSASGRTPPSTLTITPVVELPSGPREPGPVRAVPTMPVYALIITILGLVFSARKYIK